MKTITREIVIKSIEYDTVYGKNINKEVYYVYKIETNSRLNLDALQHVITESVKVPERLDEFMVLHEIGQSEIVEFLNKNYKKQ
jgi:hypothetical protein